MNIVFQCRWQPVITYDVVLHGKNKQCSCYFHLFLSQENAHFAISEALIAAIEHMKWNQVLRPAVPSDQSGVVSPLEDSEVESDEEIVKLKQKIQVCIQLLSLHPSPTSWLTGFS